MLKPTYSIPRLPPKVDLETVPILKALATANRALAELKGRAATITDQGILIDTLTLQEAKASSEIENIVTTQDEVFQADLFPRGPQSPAAKEVAPLSSAWCWCKNRNRRHGSSPKTTKRRGRRRFHAG
jgi:Fic family protein